MKKLVLSLLLVFVASTAWANTIINTYPSWVDQITNGYYKTAQTFTAPADTVLLNYQFGIAPRSDDGTLNFSIYNWSASGPAGTSLYSATLPWTTGSNDIIVPGINLTLTTGNQYGAVIDLLGYNSQSVHFENDAYSGGNGFWASADGLTWYSLPLYDHQFRAEFGASVPVPEPSAMLLLGSGLAGLVGYGRRRFKK